MCLFPLKAKLNEFGTGVDFTSEGDLRLPCGKCSECVSKRAIEWATRARHEIATHYENCFITLTYCEENLPSIFVVKTEFQKFIKRLRKHIKQPIRYMVSHEYGSNTFRPHHHAIIFGYTFKDQKFLKTTKKGESLYTSTELEKLWTHGFHSIGTANEKTAYYIASYSLKGKKHSLTDPKTGELVQVSDSMDCSKRPAIGYNFFVENHKQMIDSESILPRYYFKKLATLNPTLHERYENDRMFKFKSRSAHETYAKFIIDQSKSEMKNEFRTVDAAVKAENEFLEDELLTKRNDYHFKNMEKLK